MKRFLSVMAVAIPLTLGVSAAQADIKIFPATLCEVLTGLGVKGAGGTVANTSSVVSTSISCPLVRDHPTLRPTRIEVSVVDNSSALVGDKDIRCRAFFMNRFATSAQIGAFVSTAGTNSAGTILTLPLPAVAPVDGGIVLQCIIPRRGVADPSSFVSSIKLTEPDPAP